MTGVGAIAANQRLAETCYAVDPVWARLVKRTSGASVGLGLAYAWMPPERTARD